MKLQIAAKVLGMRLKVNFLARKFNEVTRFTLAELACLLAFHS